MQNYCVTYSGKRIDFDNPTAENIRIYDIAVALSRLPRYCGHTKFHYSVAQHSVLVAEKVYSLTGNKKKALAGLLHEISEAYGIGDINGIFKRRLGTRARQIIKDYEHKLLKCVDIHMMPEIVDIVDSRILIDEMRQLFRPKFMGTIQFKDPKYNMHFGYGIKIHRWFTYYTIFRFLMAYRKYSR